MSERRLVKRMVSYWESLKGEYILPPMGKFNSSAVPDIWEYCCMLSKIPSDGNRTIFKYEYVGKEIEKAFGRNPVGEQLSSSIYNVPGGEIVRKLEESLTKRQPVLEQGQFINAKNKVVKYRSCIIPFGKSDGTATNVIIGLSWKAF